MARFKPVHKGLKLLPVDFDKQISPGSFEHALCYLIAQELDLTGLGGRYPNDDEGAPAYEPAVLLKSVLRAYSRGIVGGRHLEAACREQVLFIAVSGDCQPHFTPRAAFGSGRGEEVAKLFAPVLSVCDRQGLIAREMFAIDGVKLPRQASKARSGTRKDSLRQADALPQGESRRQRQQKKLARLKTEAKQRRDWRAQHQQDRTSAQGKVRLSHRTDNESAKRATGKGVIQGYTGVAVVDEAAPIMGEAQAPGRGSAQQLLIAVVEATAPYRNDPTVYSAEAGYHSEAHLEALAQAELEAFIPDHGYRKPDERYSGQEAHRAQPDSLYDTRPPPEMPRRFKPKDFDPLARTCTCPAGQPLYRSGNGGVVQGYPAIKCRGTVRGCVPCPRRERCLRTAEKTRTQQVAFFLGKAPSPESHTDRMKAKLDSPCGREMSTRGLATVEPVFGNLRYPKSLHHFTLRGQAKVNGQWKLYCLTHTIEKWAHHGCGH